jgi:hypothetical protein
MGEGLPVVSEHRLIVCGGRDFTDVLLLWRTLDKIPDVRLVVDGASDDVTGEYVGADYWGHQWALARGIKAVRYHADWRRFGRGAGPIRNGQMLKSLPTLVVAFRGGIGTANMIKQARNAGVPVKEIA